ncbi:Phage-related integrase [Pectobacterium wasabiae CFBP 3304]|nr:Phage-related integrase [Pectobacterium wasabiae CFBP 3304]
MTQVRGVFFYGGEEDVLAIKASELKNKKYIAQWRSTLETYAYPFIAQKAVSEITKTDLLAILEPIWLTKNEAASRVRVIPQIKRVLWSILGPM